MAAGRPKRYSPAERARRAEWAREMTRRRLAKMPAPAQEQAQEQGENDDPLETAVRGLI